MPFAACAAAESNKPKEPKEPRAANFRLGEKGEAHANMRELLLYAILVIANRNSVGELDKWAEEVRVERNAALELQEHWKPLDKWGTHHNVSKIYTPVIDAMNKSWETGDLAGVATAMRAATWH